MTKKIILLGLLFSSLLNATPITNRDYAGVKSELQSIADRYPHTATLISLGMSDSGSDILGIQIGSGKTASLVVAAHHGNEYASTEVALGFAEETAKNPIPDQTTFIIPVLNIKGYDHRQREEEAQGFMYDPNRNYPGPCGTEGPFTLKSTKLLADFIDKENIVSSATIHAYFPAVVYPWGLSSRQVETPYRDTFRLMADDATHLSHYEIGNSTDVIYPANGTFEDYAYWKHGIWSMLFEVGESFRPNSRDLAEIVRVNVPGLRLMLANAPTVRAEQHDFSGECSFMMMLLDRHDE